MRFRVTLSLLLLAPSVSAAQTLFRLPFVDTQGVLFRLQPILHVDHDPVDKQLNVECVNYDGVGFPWCYDQHDGTDFLLSSGFVTMDTQDVQVVAAADGVVTEAVDGNYDRCHGDLSSMQVDCDGHPVVANRVVLLHADGLVSLYYHLKKGSVQVAAGQQVSCGDLLGYVGSSGQSSTPHLHFEVQDQKGETIDPFAGPKSQPTSYWTQQSGAFGRPGDRCQGEPLAPDAGPPDGAPPDGSVPVPPPDQGTGVPPAGDHAGVASRAGCSTGEGGCPPLSILLLMAAFMALRSYARSGNRC